MPVVRRTNLLLDQNVTFNQPTDSGDGLPKHIIKLPFGFCCRLCNSHPQSRPQVNEHVGSRQHQSMLVLRVLEENQAFALANKNDVTVDVVVNDVEHTTPSVCKFTVKRRTVTAFTLRVHNHNAHSVKLDFCDFTRPMQRSFYKILNGRPAGKIGGDGDMDIKLQVKVPNVGKFSKSLFLKFSADEYDEPFYIVKQFQAVCTNAIIETLKPSEPYRPVPRAQVRSKNLEIIGGLKVPNVGGNVLEIVRPLKPFRIPPLFRSAVNHGLKDDDVTADVNVQTEIQKTRSRMEETLSFDNYTDRWCRQLYLEKLQADISIQTYNMSHVNMTWCRENHAFLMLEVPGLAENRPSLLKGDVLYVSIHSEAEDDNKKEYEGHVHLVELSRVRLGFSNKLLQKVQGNLDKIAFDVRFIVPEHVYRLQQRAITMATADPLLSNVLFPSDEAKRPSLMYPLNAQANYYNHDVSENPEQARAIRHIVSGTSRPAPYLLYGPPGTGKTVTLVEAIMQCLHVHKDAHILACAPSNSAADLISQRIAFHMRKDAADKLFRIHARSRLAIPGDVKPYSNYRGGEIYYPSRADLQKYSVIVTTLSTAGRLSSAAFPEGHFTHLFVDECGQATEPETLIAMAGILCYDTDKFRNGGQVVLAGDPKQLGPVIHSPFAEKFGLGVSLLERLMDRCSLYERKADGMDPPYDVTVMTELRHNYRSHPAILEEPNRQFYHGDLFYSADERERTEFCDWPELAKPKFPIIFHGTMGSELREGSSPSFFNSEEISTVVEYVEKIMDHRKPGFSVKDIGIITPYRKQVEKLKKVLRQRSQELEKIRVGTVEEFQGQERTVIIVSTVRSNPNYGEFDTKFKLGFVANPKKFNVAITRAMALLIVVGNPRCLKQDPNWGSFISYCQRNEVLVGVETEDDDDVEIKLNDVVKQMLQMRIDPGQVRPDTPDLTRFYTAPELKDENIELVTSLDEFRRCKNRVTQPGSVVAVDAEWTPFTGRDQTLALLQLAVNDRVFILDIPELNKNVTDTEWCRFFTALFTSEDVIKVGFQLSCDLSMILTSFRHLNNSKNTSIKDVLHPTKLNQVCDLSVRSLELEKIDGLFLPRDVNGELIAPGDHSLADLVRKTKGKPLDKGPQLSDWDKRPLSKQQLRYAAIDAFVLLGVFTFVTERLAVLGHNFDLFKKLNNKFWNKLYGQNGREKGK